MSKIRINLNVTAASDFNIFEVWQGETKVGTVFRLAVYFTARKDLPSGVAVKASVKLKDNSDSSGSFVTTSILNDSSIPNGEKIWHEFTQNWRVGDSAELLRKASPTVKWTFVHSGAGGVQ